MDQVGRKISINNSSFYHGFGRNICVCADGHMVKCRFHMLHEINIFYTIIASKWFWRVFHVIKNSQEQWKKNKLVIKSCFVDLVVICLVRVKLIGYYSTSMSVLFPSLMTAIFTLLHAHTLYILGPIGLYMSGVIYVNY